MDRHTRTRRTHRIRCSPVGGVPADHSLRRRRWLHGAGARSGGHCMKWVTRARPKTDRIACPWLISKFINPGAEILYVPAAQVLDVAADQDAVSFDAPGARYDHRDGKCTFEVLIDDHDLTGDPALMR